MQKYKLINFQTGEKTLCDKVVIDGFDYYVNDEVAKLGDFVYNGKSKEIYKITIREEIVNYELPITCTNNPNIDIPQVVDEVDFLSEKLAKERREKHAYSQEYCEGVIDGYEEGYNKCLETKGNSDEDVIEFLNWIGKDGYPCIDRTKKGLWVLHPQESKDFTPKELLQLWKEEQPRIVYYNE